MMKRFLSLFLLIVFVSGMMAGCNSKSITKEPQAQGPVTLADFETAAIGILTGSSFDSMVTAHFPNAERQYFGIISDMILALSQGKIDGFMCESTYVAAAQWESVPIAAVEEPVQSSDSGFIFPKDSEYAHVREELNAFIRDSKENGFLEELEEKWFGSAEPTDHFDPESLTGENGTFLVAVAPDVKPMCYLKDDTMTGYDIDVLCHFAQEYGYKLEFLPINFDAILTGVVTGKYDFAAGGINLTEERQQSVDFSDAYFTCDIVMAVNAETDSMEQVSYWDSMKEDFDKTFIRENRWELILEGIAVTMLISICSIVAGTLFGFGLYMLSRTDRKFLQRLTLGVAKVYSRIVAGTPVVVILMILFYVVFGKFRDMSGVVVSIIGFTLTFGAFVYDHMTVSVDSVDRGQTEAAYALGYPKNKTFFRIVMPQAMKIFLPTYCGQSVEIIKATSVVGYVAVNDLTKMGDIIRSNTYEAFFPLIATAVIYFLLTWVLALLLGFVQRHYEPKRRSKEDILKGVKTV